MISNEEFFRKAQRERMEQETIPEKNTTDKKYKVVTALKEYVESAGVPITKFDPEFAVKMMSAMMVSYFKYGTLSKAYPLKFNAVDDIRARLKKYRETGNKHYLVDVANFAMIESMHPGIAAEWFDNDAADSPGRSLVSGRRLVQEDNDGNRIMGETILRNDTQGN